MSKPSGKGPRRPDEDDRFVPLEEVGIPLAEVISYVEGKDDPDADPAAYFAVVTNEQLLKEDLSTEPDVRERIAAPESVRRKAASPEPSMAYMADEEEAEFEPYFEPTTVLPPPLLLFAFLLIVIAFAL